MGTSLLLVLLLSLAPAAPADDWEVDEACAPVTVLEQTFREGTWISVDVSPDGTELVFDLLGHLYLLPLAGGTARPLTSGRAWDMFPRWSPDGRRIAFTSDRDGGNNLWVMEADGRLPQNVSKERLPVFQGDWSADGRALYGTRLDLQVQLSGWRYGLLGSRQEVVAALGRQPVNHFQENPADGWLYWVQDDGSLPGGGPRLIARHLETGELATLVERPGGAAAARISPDGDRVAYVHRDDQDTVLVLRELRGGSERVLRRGLDRGRFDSRGFYGAYPNLSWHPDGGSLVLSWGGGLQRVDAVTGEATPIPFEAPVRRELDATIRFPLELPTAGRTTTRSHRFARRVTDGVLHETLGDLWLLEAEGRPSRRLTDSAAHETSPVELPGTPGLLAWASFRDDELGGAWIGDAHDPKGLLAAARRLPGRPSQYGSLAAAPAADGGTLLLALRGGDEIQRGMRLEDQTTFELLRWDLPAGVLAAAELPEPVVVTRVDWTSNRYAHHPPVLLPEPERASLLFTEFAGDALQLTRIGLDGRDERLLYLFPDATEVAVSPDRRFVAFREHHRSWLSPFEPLGTPITLSAADGDGLCLRVDPEDGDFMAFSADGAWLSWVRGPLFHEKRVGDITSGSGDRRRTSLAVEYEVDVPATRVALRGVRVLTMDDAGTELDGATVLIDGARISAVGRDVELPADAVVYDLPGRVVMPGLFDAHGHYGSEISLLNVIELRPYGLAANLAYGVTTMYDVYGTTQKDFWLSDMLRAGAVRGPRLFSVGDPIFGTRYRRKMHRAIASDAEAREHARFNRDHGATALKDYSNHRRDSRQMLAAAARELRLNLVSESFGDPAMGLTLLVDGFTGIEHTLGLEDLYSDVAALFGATDAGLTPTLVVVYNGPAGDQYFHARERLWEDDKLLHFFRADELLRLRRPRHHFDDDWSIARVGAALRKLHDAGMRLNLGAHGQMMGLGAHWELELLTMAGFTPREALRMGTINGHRHHGLDHELGSVEPGKLADLIVLSADPTADIRNSRAIELVLINGAVHDGRDGSRLLPDGEVYAPLYFMTDN